ncbi:MAG: N-acetylmuramoyl-L-alanine amidase [Rikenellaceae bacterium]|nr:N-acetylmuramoyl-L-alanine amidase [Rikenellaceae bacterium]
MSKVFIGAGHGGGDSGAVGRGGLLEKSLNLSIAKACAAELERHGVKVKLSRTKDENDPVEQEVAECNSYAPDLAVDIHNNAGGGDGAETFYSRVGGTGKKLAENILTEIAAMGQKSRGAKTRLNSSGADYYAFIRQTKAPAVIVECAFVDSADIALIDTEPERTAIGEAIARGILRTLGIAYKPEKSPQEPRKFYRVQTGAFSDERNAKAEVQRLKRAGFEAIIVSQ